MKVSKSQSHKVSYNPSIHGKHTPMEVTSNSQLLSTSLKKTLRSIANFHGYALAYIVVNIYIYLYNIYIYVYLESLETFLPPYNFF